MARSSPLPSGPRPAGGSNRDALLRNLAVCVLQSRPLPGSGPGSAFLTIAQLTGEDGRPGFSADASLIEVENALRRTL
jgi:hypothetical protein